MNIDLFNFLGFSLKRTIAIIVENTSAIGIAKNIDITGEILKFNVEKIIGSTVTSGMIEKT